MIRSVPKWITHDVAAQPHQGDRHLSFAAAPMSPTPPCTIMPPMPHHSPPIGFPKFPSPFHCLPNASAPNHRSLAHRTSLANYFHLSRQSLPPLSLITSTSLLLISRTGEFILPLACYYLPFLCKDLKARILVNQFLYPWLLPLFLVHTGLECWMNKLLIHASFIIQFVAFFLEFLV
jgi:hypothetical protein